MPTSTAPNPNPNPNQPPPLQPPPLQPTPLQPPPPPFVGPNVPAGTILINAVKGIADASLPGASLLIEGNLKSGTYHLVGGLVARALFGPIGWIAVAADSFSLSVTGKHIYQQFVDVEVSRVPPTPPPAIPPG
jgi:hypothetical protein